MKNWLSKSGLCLLLCLTVFCSCMAAMALPAGGLTLDMEAEMEAEGLDFGGMNAENGGSYDTEVKHGGSRSVKIEASKLDWGAVYVTDLKGGKTYVFSMWVKTEKFINSENFALFAKDNADPSQMIIPNYITPIESGTADWKKYEYTFSLDKDATVTFGFQPLMAGKCRGTFWIDDVYIGEGEGNTPVTEAPAPTEAPVTTEAPATTEAPVITEAAPTETTAASAASSTTKAAAAATSTVPKDSDEGGFPWVPVVIVAAVVVLAAAGACVYYFVIRKKKA